MTLLMKIKGGGNMSIRVEKLDLGLGSCKLDFIDDESMQEEKVEQILKILLDGKCNLKIIEDILGAVQARAKYIAYNNILFNRKIK